MTNPLLNDRDISFLLYEVFDAASLLVLPHFADHSKETFDGYTGLCARFARETVFPAFKAMDEEPPGRGSGGRTEPRSRDLRRGTDGATGGTRYRHAPRPYEIISPLGAGGMGEAYRAKDTRLGRGPMIVVAGK